MKVINIKIPLYHENIKIIITKDFNKALKINKINYDFDVNLYQSFVWLKSKDIHLYIMPKSDIGIIAHESVHIVNEIFKRASIKLDIENDEPQAYLMGWVVDKIHKAVK